MKQVFRLLRFVKPYWKKSLLSLGLLVIVVVLDLAIPRLVQRIIDQGILAGNIKAVGQTFLLMLMIWRPIRFSLLAITTFRSRSAKGWRATCPKTCLLKSNPSPLGTSTA